VKKKDGNKNKSGFGLLKGHRGLHETWRKLHEEDWKHEQEEMDEMMNGFTHQEFQKRLKRVLGIKARARRRARRIKGKKH